MMTYCFYCNKLINRRPCRIKKGPVFCCTSHHLLYEYENGLRDKSMIEANETLREYGKNKFKNDPTIRINKWGYKLIYIPITKWKLYHIYIWEKHNGPVPKGYHLHHIDENKLNNNIENLKLLTNSEHQKLHQRKHDNLGKFV